MQRLEKIIEDIEPYDIVYEPKIPKEMLNVTVFSYYWSLVQSQAISYNRSEYLRLKNIKLSDYTRKYQYPQ